MYKRYAKPISYEKEKRKRKNVKYIVIHNTGNYKDTAKNNADYFATGNTREAGAHLFIDRDGKIAKSIPLNRTAHSVGGLFSTSDGAGSVYTFCTNKNSVSIELCDIVNQPISNKQLKALIKTIKYVKRYCKNVKYIVRHWDVNGKDCPHYYKGVNNKEWEKLWKKLKTYI
ncbi:MAG: N-acetylmuramoyl-L-alanine amidase [Methanobrevibacter sp.]|nr:N-acetylmuramoyl-L-alanine amidase [Methanobrevibacter sp.]